MQPPSGMFSCPVTSERMPTIQRSRNILDRAQYTPSMSPKAKGRRMISARMPMTSAKTTVWTYITM